MTRFDATLDTNTFRQSRSDNDSSELESRYCIVLTVSFRFTKFEMEQSLWKKKTTNSLGHSLRKLLSPRRHISGELKKPHLQSLPIRSCHSNDTFSHSLYNPSLQMPQRQLQLVYLRTQMRYIFQLNMRLVE